jgi:hypothetical protein
LADDLFTHENLSTEDPNRSTIETAYESCLIENGLTEDSNTEVSKSAIRHLDTLISSIILLIAVGIYCAVSQNNLDNRNQADEVSLSEKPTDKPDHD